jgi:hypothetical protein
MTTTRVHKDDPNCDVYIGRGEDGEFHLAKAVSNHEFDREGWLGNPYRMSDYSRQKAIELYERDLQWIIEEKPWFRSVLKNLYGKNLGCYCAEHQDCHGDILIRKINALYWEEKT